MRNLKKSFYLVLLTALFSFTTVNSRPLSPADSIRRTIPALKGADRVTAYYNLCRLAAAEDNAKYELKCIDDFINEAHKQKDFEKEGLARSMQMDCYYNYKMKDEIVKALPGHLKFMAEHQLWDSYYNSWDILVEINTDQDKNQTALEEAKKMYADAHSRKINYGIGVAAYCMGNAYQYMQRYADANKAFNEAIKSLSKEEDITLLLSAFNAQSETLDALKQYDQMRSLAARWRNVLDAYKKKAESQGMTPSLNGRYLYCTLSEAVAEIETKHFDKAVPLLAEATKLAEGRKAIAQFKLLDVRSRYYAAIGNYQKAIDCNNENIKLIISVGDSVTLLALQEQQAALLLKAGHPLEAAKLYQTVLAKKDALRSTQLTSQLDELRTIYGMDKLELENAIITEKHYFSLALCILLIIVCGIYARYSRRLKTKNEALYETIKQLEQSEIDADSAKSKIPDNELSREELLYRRLCKLMREEKVFKEQIGRNELAEKLGTNATYIADTVKKFSNGMKVNEFVNAHRLRYASNLLTDRLDLSVSDIGEEAGFTSRSTYHRLFTDYFGMSPSEYRNIASSKTLEKKKEDKE